MKKEQKQYDKGRQNNSTEQNDRSDCFPRFHATSRVADILGIAFSFPAKRIYSTLRNDSQRD